MAIKADGLALVNSAPFRVRPLALLAALACFAMPGAARADVSEKDVQTLEQQEFGIDANKAEKKKQEPPANPDRPPEDYQPQAEAEKVKSIEAEEFRVRLIKRSHSGKVLLFEDLNDNRPRPGRIILLKKDNDDIAAVRVLRNFPGKFAAKITLPINDLKNDIEYRAIKKLGDKIVALIKEREKRGKDLESAKTDEDLAKEVNPDDNELDRGIPQPKKKTQKVLSKPEGASGPADLSSPTAATDKGKPEPLFTKDGQELSDPDSVEVKDEDEAAADVSIQEDLPLEPHRSAVSLEFATIKSVDVSNNPASYTAVGLRYAFNIWRMALIQKRNLQDMFSFEAGLFYYTISGFAVPTDNVTVYSLIGTLRYSLLIGESLSAFGYLGFNHPSASSDTKPVVTPGLSGSSAAMGIGAMLKIGPAWAVRLDVGSDLFGVGAVLKF